MPAQSASAASFVPISGAGSTFSFNAINDWITNVVEEGMTVSYNPVGPLPTITYLETASLPAASSGQNLLPQAG
jgi:hypothetical protein